MMPTLLGLVLLPLALFFFFSNRVYLYYLTIFFIPFSASVVVNLTGASSTGVQATMFLGFLWVCSEIIRSLIKGEIQIIQSQRLSVVLLCLFGLVVMYSLVMPVILTGKLEISSAVLYSSETVAQSLSFRNITQTLYLLYGITITIFVVTQNDNIDRLTKSLKVYVIAGGFVSLWGYFQLICHLLHLPYPVFIFNNNLNPSAQGYTAVLTSLNIKRISSVAVEPSIFAQFLLTVIPIVLFAIISKRYILSPLLDKLNLFLMLTILILSTATTAYLGLSFMAIVSFLALLLFKKFRTKHLMLIGMFLSFTGLIFTIGFSFIQTLVIDKLQSYSGLERGASVTKAWQYFNDYPLLGVGWGSVTSHDTVANLSANSGILGLVCFCILIFYTIFQTITGLNMAKQVKRLEDLRFWGLGILVSLFTLLFTNNVSGFTYVYSHFWFILGITISFSTVLLKEVHSELKEREI